VQTWAMQPRRLLLICHATAARGPIDADRPLTGAGVGHARAIGTWFARAELTPDRVIVSPARRAAQTWENAAAQLSPCPQPITDPRIYDNTVEQVLAAIREAPDDALTVAVVGHNPSIRELAAALDDGRGSPEARRALDRGFPAAGVAVFVLPGSFAATAPGAATLTDFTVPGD
jgi:phosphohistidine phosphatase